MPPRKPGAGTAGAGGLGGKIPLIISVFALFLSIISLFMVLSGGGTGLSSQDMQEIAQSLRELKEKEVTLTAPISGTVPLDATLPASELFPDTYSMPVDIELPVGAEVTAIMPDGRPVTLTIEDQVIPISDEIELDFSSATSGREVQVQKDLTVSGGELSATLTLGDVYGEGLDALIEKLESG